MTTEQTAIDFVAMVRARDYRRFLAIQVAPRAARPSLYALTAFASEMAHIPHHVNEPLAGFMRYAWWRERLEAMQAGEPPRPHPLLQELAPWLAVHPQGYGTLLGMIETGQYLLEDPSDATRHDARDALLDEAWSMHLGEDHARVKRALDGLPKERRISPLYIMRMVINSLRF